MLKNLSSEVKYGSIVPCATGHAIVGAARRLVKCFVTRMLLGSDSQMSTLFLQTTSRRPSCTPASLPYLIDNRVVTRLEIYRVLVRWEKTRALGGHYLSYESTELVFGFVLSLSSKDPFCDVHHSIDQASAMAGTLLHTHRAHTNRHRLKVPVDGPCPPAPHPLRCSVSSKRSALDSILRGSLSSPHNSRVLSAI